ncbi:MAG: hypothetical protein ACXWUG_32030 [Polyangiales bacterium]
MARVSFEEIERELQAQNEACERIQKRLAALGPDTRVILGESFLEDLLESSVPSQTPVGSFIRV